MSEKMYPIPFDSLMNWVTSEYAQCGDVFGVHKHYHASGKSLPIFGERIETPFGPAAGPNSQLAQNIIAAYAAGARFFEVKTVQKMDGAELAACVPRPCILAADEGYNQEWSTELTVQQAQDEYIKAWCALKIMSKVYGFGDPDGFVFNMSVGYDLDGIKGRKVNTYINNMMDAGKTAQFKECKKVLTELFPEEKDFIASISPNVSRSVTLSTLHGCPPQEIERIASYLLTKKHLHTFVKCNPTILGYKTARSILDSMGYDYIVFDEHHFNEDLQWEDAVPMFERLQKLADKEGLEFGLKLSNTFPVDTTRGELPNDEMYMSGRSLFPLTIEMCNRISRAFGGKMRISFAGGAEYFNCDKLFAAGIWPITVATTILKPGGYNRLLQMVEKVEPMEYRAFAGTDSAAISDLAASARTNYHHLKPIKPLPSRKSTEQVPWLDCFIAPCKGGCPIEQDIPEYLELCRKGLYGPALKLITEKNALPFITGTICAHRCQGKCSRNFYEESVHIRDTKLLAAQKGYNALMASIKLPERVEGKRVAIIGGGPTGIAAAYFLGREGVPTTIFERERKLGGVPRYVIPAFRISDEAIDKDIALMLRYGVEVKCGKSAPSVAELKEMGYTHILLATGAWKAGKLDIEGNVQGVIEWMKKEKKQVKPNLSGNIVVVGAGNTAMDAARVAKRMGAEFICGKEAPSLYELKAEGYEYILLATGAQKHGALSIQGNVMNVIDFLYSAKNAPETLALGNAVAVIGGGNTAMDAARAAKRIGVEKVSIVYRRTKKYMPADEEELALATEDGVEFAELLAPVEQKDGMLVCKKMELGELDESGRRSVTETDETVTIPADTVIAAVGEKPDAEALRAYGAEPNENGRVPFDCGAGVYAAGDALRGPATVVEAIADARRFADAVIGFNKGYMINPAAARDYRETLARKHRLMERQCGEAEAKRCLGCSTVCESCVSSCPNRANAAIKVKGKAQRQIVHIDALCNECGNCAVFCPYSGRPYKDKLTVFADEASFTDSENNGFLLIDRDSKTVKLRLNGGVGEVCLTKPNSLDRDIEAIILTVISDYGYML